MTTTDPVTEPRVDADRVVSAKGIVGHYAKIAAATGLIPIPVVDFFAVTGIQLKMIKELCDLYGIEFRENIGRASLLSIIGGSVPAMLVGSATKLVPLVGAIGAIAFTPLVAGTTTYGVGNAFIDHVESGGTLLTFRGRRIRDLFRRHRDNYRDPDAVPAR